jgi:polyisoprenoid-binding protein YceI
MRNMIVAAGVSIGLCAGETVAIHGGNASFAVSTNTLGISVKGKSDALEGQADLHRAGDGLVLDHVSAWLPPKTLVTGMTLRDEHMRKYVFDKPGGESPDVRFEAEGVSCNGVAPGREVNCQVSGTLAIRGIPKSFSMAVKVRQDSGEAFHIRGEGSVKLSDYGIEQPAQLGVKTANEVQIHLDFAARPGASTTAKAGVAR